jgi:hypothetical protein
VLRGEPVAGEDVAAQHLHAGDRLTLLLVHACGLALVIGMRECVAHALWVASERTNDVSVGAQRGDEQRAGEAACAGDEDAHVSK